MSKTKAQIEKELIDLREQYKKKPDKILEVRGKLLKRAIEMIDYKKGQGSWI